MCAIAHGSCLVSTLGRFAKTFATTLHLTRPGLVQEPGRVLALAIDEANRRTHFQEELASRASAPPAPSFFTHAALQSALNRPKDGSLNTEDLYDASRSSVLDKSRCTALRQELLVLVALITLLLLLPSRALLRRNSRIEKTAASVPGAASVRLDPTSTSLPSGYPLHRPPFFAHGASSMHHHQTCPEK